MNKILITGDRSMHPVAAVNVLAPVLGALAERFPSLHGRDLITGDLPGVERAARYLLPNIQTFAYPRDAEGKPLFAEAYEDLDEVVRVVIIHPEPLDSRVAKAAMQVWPQEKVWLPMSEPVTFNG